jgi:ubiquinol-cytochrome c reductase cytochrome b subunit
VLLPLAFFALMAGYPFLERWVTGDARYHHILDRPRNSPARTALGVAVIAMAVDLQLAGAQDVIAFHLDMPVEDVNWALRAGFFVLPLAALQVTRHVCVALQRADRRRLRAGTVTRISVQRVADAPGAGAAGPAGYAGAESPVPEEEKARLVTRRPDELITPIPRHLIPLPTPGRAAGQLRARLNHLYLLSRLEHAPVEGNGQADAADGAAGKPAADADRRAR